MSKEQSFEELNELTRTALISILEQAKVKFLKSQEYEMAAKMRDLIRLEQMEEGEERRQFVQELINFYNIK